MQVQYNLDMLLFPILPESLKSPFQLSKYKSKRVCKSTGHQEEFVPRPVIPPRALAPSALPNYDDLGIHAGLEERDAA